MNYYETFKPTDDSDVLRFGKERAELAETVKNARRNLERGRDEQASLGKRIADLKRLSGKSLAGGAGDYEKFKTSLRKLSESLDICDEAVMSLESDILPGAESALRDAEMNLKNALVTHLLASRHVADEKINSLLRDCLRERQDFLDAFAKIYSDFGVVLCVNDEVYAPSPWTYQEAESLKRRLGMSEPQQAVPEPVETPQIVQAEPTASEAAQDTPEAEFVPSLTVLGVGL